MWMRFSVLTSGMRPLPPGYHVLLGSPTFGIHILPELTLNVPASDGHIGSPFGFQVAEVDINYFDTQISAYMLTHPQIQPSTFPIFITANTYLTEGGCCIGGYHSANGPQTYANFDYDPILACSRKTYPRCRMKSASGWTIL